MTILTLSAASFPSRFQFSSQSKTGANKLLSVKYWISLTGSALISKAFANSASILSRAIFLRNSLLIFRAAGINESSNLKLRRAEKRKARKTRSGSSPNEISGSRGVFNIPPYRS